MCLVDTNRMLPVPPPMIKRQISKWEKAWPGDAMEFTDGDRKFTLFIPSAYKPGKAINLTIHFHSAIWHAIQEHLDRGTTDPVIAFYPGEGSTIYSNSFDDKQRLSRWFEIVAQESIKRGAPKDACVQSLSISSFSAGFGAVRQVIKDEIAFKMLKRVVLCDSMYGSLDSNVKDRVPAKEHIECWKALAEAAVRGEKTFCVSFSQVPTPTYASSSECAAALVRLMGGELKPVEKGTLVATVDRDFPLLYRFDKGGFHVWGYGGEDGQAHMTHARHLADLWKALDRVREP